MMDIDTRHNEANEIVKYQFFEELKHVQQKDPKTVRQHVNAIHEFELATGFKGFKSYTAEDAKVFKHHLNNKKNKRTGQSISRSLYANYVAHVRTFFEWLYKNAKGYTKLKPRDIAYLKVTQNEANQAKATNYQESHEVAGLLATIRNMPEQTIVEKRNKAMFSLVLLTSARISSLQTARVGSVKYMKEFDNWAFLQNPKTHKTKFAKNITSFFVGQCQDIIDNIANWQAYIVSQGFRDNDYLFPRTKSGFNKQGEPIVELTKEVIKSDTVIRDALKDALTLNGLKYISPHKFRHSITREARKSGANTDTLIALAENFGQKTGMATLIANYGDNYLYKRAYPENCVISV